MCSCPFYQVFSLLLISLPHLYEFVSHFSAFLFMLLFLTFFKWMYLLSNLFIQLVSFTYLSLFLYLTDYLFNHSYVLFSLCPNVSLCNYQFTLPVFLLISLITYLAFSYDPTIYIYLCSLLSFYLFIVPCPLWMCVWEFLMNIWSPCCLLTTHLLVFIRLHVNLCSSLSPYLSLWICHSAHLSLLPPPLIWFHLSHISLSHASLTSLHWLYLLSTLMQCATWNANHLFSSTMLPGLLISSGSLFSRPRFQHLQFSVLSVQPSLCPITPCVHVSLCTWSYIAQKQISQTGPTHECQPNCFNQVNPTSPCLCCLQTFPIRASVQIPFKCLNCTHLYWLNDTWCKQELQLIESTLSIDYPLTLDPCDPMQPLPTYLAELFRGQLIY